MSPARSVARMAGTSIATPAARVWIKDFLNAVFYARSRKRRSLDDLRLAHGILNTYAARAGRRLGARDLGAFHRAFGAARLRKAGRIDAEALRAGASALLGEWFAGAWADPARCGWGVAFESAAERDAYDPGVRLEYGRLGALTPPERPEPEQEWSTYPPVPLADPEAAVALLSEPARWLDIASAAGRFTPVRPGGLEGQTFEIELAIKPAPRALLNTRGYVTCTAVRIGPDAAGPAVALNEHVEVLPAGAEPLALIDLTTHEGHFMGAAVSRLLVCRERGGDGAGWVRDIGSWDPMPPHLAVPYRAGGHRSQLAFWGPDDPEASMLVQLALAVAA